MKRFTRLVCLILSVVTFLGTIPAMAADNESVKANMSGLRDQLYQEHVVPLSDNYSNDAKTRSVTDDRLNRIREAENYVRNMNISNELKAECLEELESFRNDETCYLEAYSVYVPVSRSGEAYFGTYENTDFYMKWISHSTKTYIRETTDDQQRLEAWKSGLYELAIFVADATYEYFDNIYFPWSLFAAHLGSNYTVKDGDFVEHYAVVDSDLVKTYVLENGSYVAVHGLDYGYVEPYLVYHTIYKTNGSYTHEVIEDQIDCDMPATRDILINSYAGYQSRYFQTLIGNQLDWRWQ